jgi:hypothetical protein
LAPVGDAPCNLSGGMELFVVEGGTDKFYLSLFGFLDKQALA